MNTAQRWWHGLDHYYRLTAFLAARGLQKTTCRLIALVIFGLSVISITLIWSPTGPHGLRSQVLAVAVAACCWGMTVLWLRGRWPSAFESRICVCLGSLCVAVSCLIQADPLAGLFGATPFTPPCIYAPGFHNPQWLTVSLGGTRPALIFF